MNVRSPCTSAEIVNASAHDLRIGTTTSAVIDFLPEGLDCLLAPPAGATDAAAIFGGPNFNS